MIARSRLEVLLALVLAMLLVVAAPVTIARAGAAADLPFPLPDGWAEICDSMAPGGEPLVTGTNCRWLRVDGIPRRYVVDVPDRPDLPPDRPWPVVLVLAGATAPGERIRERSGWVERAAAAGAIAVFPTAWSYKLKKRKVVVLKHGTCKLKGGKVVVKKRY